MSEGICPCGNSMASKESRSTCSAGTCYGCLVDRINAQRDELIKLKRERDEAYERAAQVCDDYARRDNPRAVVVCDLAATAIRDLKTEKPTS